MVPLLPLTMPLSLLPLLTKAALVFITFSALPEVHELNIARMAVSMVEDEAAAAASLLLRISSLPLLPLLLLLQLRLMPSQFPAPPFVPDFFVIASSKFFINSLAEAENLSRADAAIACIGLPPPPWLLLMLLLSPAFVGLMLVLLATQ